MPHDFVPSGFLGSFNLYDDLIRVLIQRQGLGFMYPNSLDNLQASSHKSNTLLTQSLMSSEHHQTANEDERCD